MESSKLDPADYIITRKRKKYKFAKFHNAENCFEFAEWSGRSIDIVEVGAGTGHFSVELARRYSYQQILALDVKADRLQKGAYFALDQSIRNAWFVRARADQLTELVRSNFLQSIWLTFPDPYPKDRSAGRRLTHPTFLEHYARCLSPRGELWLKHDDPSFFAWSLEQLIEQGWRIQQKGSWHNESESSNQSDIEIMTTYEDRWLSQGRTVQFVCASPPPGSSFK